MKFSNVKIGQIFFEDGTGEYYQKVSETLSSVYDMDYGKLFEDVSGTIDCEFLPDHEVEFESN